MNAGQIHKISEKLGALTATIDLMTDLWKTQEATASLGRKALHDKFESFKDDVGLQIAGLSLRVDRLTDQVTVIQPSVQGFNEDKLRAEGAKRLGKALIAGMAAAAGLLGAALHEVVGRVWPPPVH